MATSAPPGRATPQARSRPPSVRAQQAEAARFRRAVLLVLGTLVLPGIAQFIAGNRNLGRVIMQIWGALVLVVALVAWLVPLDTLAGLAVRPWLLTAFKVIAFAVALAWISLVVDAWRLGNPPSLNQKHRLLILTTTMAVVVAVATPFWLATRYATAAHDAVVALFPSGQVAAASDGRFNIVLIGSDAGRGRVGTRPDSLSVVSVDVRTGATALIGIPRNFEGARFPAGTPAAAEFPRGFTGDGERIEWMINATWTYGENNPEFFPDADMPGAEAVRQAVEGTLDLPIHYYVVVDMDGFSQLIDAVGGITVRIEEDIPIGQRGRVLAAGLHTLNGGDALWYARSRTGGSDYDRMERQRCVIGAMVRQLDPGTVLQNFLSLADASEAMITTNIPQQQLPQLVDIAWKAKDVPLKSLQLAPPLIVPADPDLGVVRTEVNNLLNTARQAAVEAQGAGTDESTDAAAADAPPADDADESPADGTNEQAGGSANDSAGEDAGSAAPAAVAVNEVCSYE